MHAGISYVTMMMLLAVGGSNELLNLVPTDMYWELKHVRPDTPLLIEYLQVNEQTDPAALIHQLGDPDFSTRDRAAQQLRLIGRSILPQLEEASHSPDPEVAMRSADLIDELQARPEMGPIWRLMAIRTLGERRAEEALGVLHPLLESEERFVSEYARRAINAIEGRAPPARAGPAALRKEDLRLLPAGCGAVAQLDLPPAPAAVDLHRLFAQMGGLSDDDARRMAGDMSRQLVDQLERAGNARLDSATIGVAAEISNTSGFVVAVLRGLHNAPALRQLLKETGIRVEERGGQQIHRFADHVAMFSVTDEQVILVLGANEQSLPLEEIAVAVRQPPAAPPFGEAMTQLLMTVDQHKPLWIAIDVTDSYREVPILPVLESLVIHGTHTEKGIFLEAEARAADAIELALAVEEFEAAVQRGVAQMQQAVHLSPMFRVIVEFLQSIEVQAEGETATGTATLENLLLAPVLIGVH